METHEESDIREHILEDLVSELDAAMRKHPSYPTEHHAYAVIKEELEEFWDEVKKQKPSKRRMREELLHVAVTAIRSIRDLEMTMKHMLKEDDDE